MLREYVSRNTVRGVKPAVFFIVALLAPCCPGATSQYKDRCLKDLVTQVPGILKSQNSGTGRFGEGVWVVIDQNVLLPLAAAWSYKNPANPYYHSAEVLQAILKGGNALIDAQDANGQWLFNKKDGSTWGQIYQPWTYTRWLRAFQMIRDDMPPAVRARWEKALLLGYTGISAEERTNDSTNNLHNIPAHHALGLYLACKIFDRPEWCKQGAAFLHRIADSQSGEGYWSEHEGPIVLYGTVYVEALGIYLAVSHDESVRPNLRKAAIFHAHFTYPDGTEVETVDERNPYYGKVRVPNVGYTYSPEGRGYLLRQIAALKGPIPADDAANLLLWGEDGEAVDCAAGNFDYILPGSQAEVVRHAPWFLVISAFTASVMQKRWVQDRQNFVSIYHDDAGLILGGGNTKLQPEWSNFTWGDTRLLRLKPGDEDPNFLPPPGVRHVPDKAHLIRDGQAVGVELSYGDQVGRILLKMVNGRRLEYVSSSGPALAAHVTLLPRMGMPARSSKGSVELSAKPFDWQSIDWLEHGEARFTLPAGTRAQWPVRPHDPYKKDGHGDPDQSRIVLDLPGSGTVTIDVRAR